MRQSILVVFLFFIANCALAQVNSTCGAASQFCSGSSSQYPSVTGAAPAQGASSWGCLGSQPNPAWFTIPVTQNGNINISLSATFDIDFICWGPFTQADINNGAACSNLGPTTQVPNSPGNFSSPTNTSQGCSYSGSNTETVVIPNAIVGQVYILLITNFSNQPQQITVNPGASSGAIGGMTVTGTPSVCAGGSATLDVAPGSGIASVYWLGPTGGFGSNFHQVVNNLQGTTVYTVVGYAATGQSCTATQIVSVQPTPTPAIVNNSPVCALNTASFLVTGANSYVWHGPAQFYSNVAAPAFNVDLQNSGTYTVIGSIGPCAGTGTTNLVVRPNPTVTVGKQGNFCYGKSFSLLSNGAMTYTWSGPGGFNYQGQNPLFVNNNFGMSGLYTIVGETNGCKGTGTVNVTINPLPFVTASTTGSICQNGSATLTAGGAYSYLWTGPFVNGAHQTTIGLVNSQLSSAGIYTVVGTDLNGCVNTATVYQQIRNNPYVNIYSTDACVNKTITLSANGGDYYHWEGPVGFVSNQQYPVITNANTFHAGVYNLTVTSVYGCVSTASIPVNVFLNPQVSVTGSIAVCKGKNFYFTANGALNYKWLGSTGIVTQNPTFSISSTSPNLETTYTLVGTDGNFCSNFIPFYPIVNELPSARVVPSMVTGCAPLCTDLVFEPHSPDIIKSDWKLNGAGTVSQIVPSAHVCLDAPSIYTVSVLLTDAKTCTSTITNTVEAYATPKANFSYTPDQPTENDNVITFSDQSSNTDIQGWTWNFYEANGNGKDTSLKQNQTITYAETGNYLVRLKVTAKNGCVDSITRLLVIAEDPTFFIPNSFTPNDDGLNDVFFPKSRAVVAYEMQIFNRWGQLLYTTTDLTQGWDGKKDGATMPNGTYIYKFTVSNADKNPRVYRGEFSLIK